RCPPPPLVRAGELCLPPGAEPQAARHVLGDVLVVAPQVTPEHRARALALLLAPAHGGVVRASAAWLWTGDPSLRPARVDLAPAPSAPPVPGPRPSPDRALPVRRARWWAGAAWTVVGGTAVTTPTTTAAECSRLLPVGPARRCVEALTLSASVDLEEVAHLLRAATPAGSPAPPGTADALALLASLGAAA
ncbi:hypothetical protein, partial [Aquipuribacter hungaricus]|uniref:hypothetical protein n=1 Tax=Aquipuribacter hungaricus TaxID=545624 RepID=UPI0030EB4883